MAERPIDWSGIVEQVLKAYGWTQAELARHMGVSDKTVSGWATGYRREPAGWLAVDLHELWQTRPMRRGRK